MRAAPPTEPPRREGAQGRNTRREWLIIALAALLWLPALSTRELWSPDEPRIAQIAEELRASVWRDGETDLAAGLILTLNGAPYSQKPPLYYWVAAALGAPFGHVDPWAARLPSALAGIAGVALSMAMTRRLFPGAGARAAPWAGLFLLLSFRWGDLSQRASLDVVLSMLELGAWVGWLRFVRGEWTRERALVCIHAALGLGMLVKGPVALLPLAVIPLATAWTQRSDDALPKLSGLLGPRYLALSIGPFLLWGAAVLASTPDGFFEEAVLDNLVGRFFSGTSHARPIYYYAVQLPLEFMPATLLLPAAWLTARQALRERSDNALAWRVLGAWVGLFAVFFTLSAGKRGAYLLPLFPALAVAAAIGAQRLFEPGRRLPFRAGSLACACALALGALAAFAIAEPTALSERLSAAEGFELPGPFLVACIAFAATAACVGTLAQTVDWSAERRLAAIAGGLAALQLVVSQLLYPSLDGLRSLRPVAEAAAALAAPGAPIGVFRHPSYRPALAYYAPGPPERFVDLLSRENVDAYFRSGGEVLITEPGRKEALGPLPAPVQARFRSGRRAIWVLAKTPTPKNEGGEGRRRAPHPPTPR